MPRITSTSRKNILFVLVLLTAFLIAYFSFPEAEPAEQIESIPATQKEALGIIIEMDKFLVSLALIVLGVLGGSIIGQVKIQLPSSTFMEILFFSSIITAIASIFSGYFLYSTTVDLLINNIVDFKTKPVTWFRNLQFISLLVSVFLLAWYVFNCYLEIKKSSNENFFDFHTMD